MREYSFTIDPNGLAKDADALDGAVLLKNIVPDNGCWRVPRAPVMPSGWTGAVQVFRGRAVTVWCDSTTVHTVNEGTLARTLVATVPAGGRWTFADFGTVWMVANGSRLVANFPDGHGGFRTVNIAVPLFGCVTAHYDTRLVYGNCEHGQNWVGWSCTAGEDIPYLLAGVAPPDGLVQLNEAGAMPMPFRGEVLGLLPLGGRVMVYGSDGVAAIRDIDGHYGLEAVPGIPDGVGIAGRGAVDGNDEMHVFVGSDGAVYAVGADLSVRRIESVVPVPDAPTVAHNEIYGDWWISGDTESLVMTDKGLGGPIQAVVRSVVRIPVIGTVGSGVAYPDDLRAEVWTNTFDCGDSGQKRITFLRVGGDGVSGTRVAVKSRFSTGAAFSQFPWIICSPEGAGFVNCSCISAQAGVVAAVVPGSRIWRVEVRYQAHDRRAIRGTRGIPKEEE